LPVTHRAHKQTDADRFPKVLVNSYKQYIIDPGIRYMARHMCPVSRYMTLCTLSWLLSWKHALYIS